MGGKKGDSIKGRTAQKVRRVGDVKGVVGAMYGDVKNYGNGGKDIAIQELGKNAQDTHNMLLHELQQYHDQLERKDNYIREVVKKSFSRNEEKDHIIMKLIEVLISQDARIQDRADRLFSLIERIFPMQIEQNNLNITHRKTKSAD